MSSGSAASGSCKTYAACDLLSASDVNTALGSGLMVSAGTEMDKAGGPYECAFSPGMNPSAAISVACEVTTNNQEAYTSFNAVFGGTSVSGLGEAAFYNATTGTLVVFFGNNGALTVLLTAPTTVDAESIMIGLAKTVLPQL